MVLTIATALAAVATPQKAEAATLKGKLHHARLVLRRSQDRLKTAEADLAAAVASVGLTDVATPTADSTATPCPTPVATPTAAPAPAGPTLEDLKGAVAEARRAVKHWTKRVRKLTAQYRAEQQMTTWERQGRWMPIIRVAAARYGVSATGMYRMMMRESGGQRYAGSSSAFKGLYQYHTRTWVADWNPWRNDSIYDGSSQIFATALAIHKGMGAQMWTTTFWSQY